MSTKKQLISPDLKDTDVFHKKDYGAALKRLRNQARANGMELELNRLMVGMLARDYEAGEDYDNIYNAHLFAIDGTAESLFALFKGTLAVAQPECMRGECEGWETMPFAMCAALLVEFDADEEQDEEVDGYCRLVRDAVLEVRRGVYPNTVRPFEEFLREQRGGVKELERMMVQQEKLSARIKAQEEKLGELKKKKMGKSG